MNIELVSFIGQCFVTVAMNLMTFLLFNNLYGVRYSKKSVYFISFFITVALMIIINTICNPYLNAVYLFFQLTWYVYFYMSLRLKRCGFIVC